MRGKPKRRKWSEKETERLKKLLHQTSDRAWIAKQLGVSVNSLNGKMHREGLTNIEPDGSHIEVSAAERSSQTARDTHLRSRAPPRPPFDDQALQAIRRIDFERGVVGVEDLVMLIDRPEDGCCFPVGDAKVDPRCYCPMHRVPGQSYCQFHLGQVYINIDPVRPDQVFDEEEAKHEPTKAYA